MTHVRGVTSVVRSFAPDAIAHIERREQPDGSGDLVLLKRWELDSDGNRREVEDALLAVPDVREAERCVRRLTTQALATGDGTPRPAAHIRSRAG